MSCRCVHIEYLSFDFTSPLCEKRAKKKKKKRGRTERRKSREEKERMREFGD